MVAAVVYMCYKQVQGTVVVTRLLLMRIKVVKCGNTNAQVTGRAQQRETCGDVQLTVGDEGQRQPCVMYSLWCAVPDRRSVCCRVISRPAQPKTSSTYASGSSLSCWQSSHSNIAMGPAPHRSGRRMEHCSTAVYAVSCLFHVPCSLETCRPEHVSGSSLLTICTVDAWSLVLAKLYQQCHFLSRT
jgi:hypothetical protein